MRGSLSATLIKSFCTHLDSILPQRENFQTLIFGWSLTCLVFAFIATFGGNLSYSLTVSVMVCVVLCVALLKLRANISTYAVTILRAMFFSLSGTYFLCTQWKNSVFVAAMIYIFVFWIFACQRLKSTALRKGFHSARISLRWFDLRHHLENSTSNVVVMWIHVTLSSVLVPFVPNQFLTSRDVTCCTKPKYALNPAFISAQSQTSESDPIRRVVFRLLAIYLAWTEIGSQHAQYAKGSA